MTFAFARVALIVATTGLTGGEATMPGHLSSQYFTGLLLAAPGASGRA